MKKVLKVTAIALGGLAALLIVGAIALSLWFDPNQYKDDIIALVKQSTGRDLKIEKKIGWSFFPRLGVEAGGLELSNAPGFGKEPMVKIDAAGVHVEFWPLLTGRVNVETFYVHGLVANLAKNAQGKTNWDDLVNAQAPAKPEPKAKKETKEKAELPLDRLTIGKLDIARATLRYRDGVSGSATAIEHFSLSTGRFVAGEPFDLKLSFALSRTDAAPVKISLASRVKASANALDLGTLSIRMDDSRLTGTLGIKNFSAPAFRFDLALDQIDLDRYLSAKPKDASKATPGAPGVAAGKPTEVSLSGLRSLDAQGKFKVGKLKAFDLHSTDAVVQLNAKDGLIRLGPNSAKLYQGAYQGQTTLDARGKTLKLSIDEKLANVSLSPLLKDAYRIDVFHGAANLNAKVTAEGFDAQQIQSTLNGTAGVDIKDGKIRGLDLRKVVAAIEQAKKEKNWGALSKVVPAAGDETPFTRLSGTAKITNGLVANDDLALESPGLGKITGKGTAHLPTQALKYSLSLGTVPFLIAGTFEKPKFSIDTEALAKQAVDRKLEKEKDKLEQKLKDRFKRKD